MTNLSIGKLATAAGVGVETVRFYEKQGLVPAPPRTAAGYRQYPPAILARLRFIVRAKTLGFTLVEIGELLALRAAPGPECDAVRALAVAKLADVEARIAQLDAMRRALAALVAQCDGGGSADACPIVDALAAEGE